MSFSLLPFEMRNQIVISGFVNPTKVTPQEVTQFGRIIVSLSLTNKELKTFCNEKLNDIKKIYDLVIKYKTYNSIYENPGKDVYGIEKIPGGNPQLYDALLTGCNKPYALHSFKDYTPEIEKDIKTIVKLTPQSMNFILGTLNCRDDVLPIFAACTNINIPTSIVEFLLKSGANPNATIIVNDKPVKVISDLKMCIKDKDRYNVILNLFKQYGLESEI